MAQKVEREPRGCCAHAEVMTPDAILRDVTCGKYRKGHGRWHENRSVRWRGRYHYPENIGEASERLLRDALEWVWVQTMAENTGSTTMLRLWVEDVWVRTKRGEIRGRPLCRRRSVETAFATAGWLSGPETGYGAIMVEDAVQGLIWRVKNGEAR